MDIFTPWGKSDPDEAPEGGPDWHPLLYHLLDAAACADALLATDPVLNHRIAHLLGLAPRPTRALLRYLVALRDLGKCARSHLACDRERYRAHFDDDPAEIPGGYNHGGALLDLFHTTPEVFAFPKGPSRHVWRTLLASLTEQHGGARGRDRWGGPHIEIMRAEDFGARCHDTAIEIAQAIARVVPAPATLDTIGERAAKQASLAIAGLTRLADWMRSNTEWFPYTRAAHTPRQYWSIARGQARRAVNETGFGAPRPRRRRPGVAQIALLAQRPGRDAVTEALALADEFARHTLDRGVYLAFPTREEAESAFEQLARDTAPERTIVLAHAGRMRRANCVHPRALKLPYLAFHADIGIGTIDQALLAVIAHRNHTLRLAGLMRRTLIVTDADRVRAIAPDALDRLLETVTMLGASVVLGAPAWTEHARARIERLFNGGRPGSTAAPAPYPANSIAAMLAQDTANVTATAPAPGTVLDDRGWRERKAPRQSAPAQMIDIDTAETPEAAAGELTRARTGRVLYIRRTVADALATLRALTRGGVKAGLLSARRTRADRARAVEALEHGRIEALVATPAADDTPPIETTGLYLDIDSAPALIARIARHAPRAGKTTVVLAPDEPARASTARIVATLARAPDAVCIETLACELEQDEGASFDSPESADAKRRRAIERAENEDRLIVPLLGLHTASGARAHHSTTSVRTRTGAPTLRLALREGATIRPLEADGDDVERAWRASEARCAEIARPYDAARPSAPAPRRHETSTLVFSRTGDGTLEAQALGHHGERLRVRYSEETGLETEII